jgi:glycosyltransferase involved in cell wall biosynthesis
VIHVVTPYGRRGPSSRVRVFEWLDRTSFDHVLSTYVSHSNSSPAHLLRHPAAVLNAERRLRRMATERPELLWLHREASPLSRGALERKLLAGASFAVYDFDDALHVDWGQGGLYRRLAPKAPKAHLAVRGADRVVAGNAVLADWASQYNDDVVIIPSCVSPASYRQKTDYTVGDPPRLGWIGSPDNEAYLLLVERSLLEVHRRTGARLLLVGTTRPSLGDLEPMIDRGPWSEAAQHTQLSDFDVALAPLPDEPYTRGKCGYRLLQYGAAAVPVVGSPVGVNERILAEFGMPAAKDEGDWTEAILDLLARPADARQALGRTAVAVVEQDYSYAAWQSRWEDAVGVVASLPTP